MPTSRITLPVAVATLVTVIAGCGGGSSTSNRGSASITGPPAATPIADTGEIRSPRVAGLSARAQYTDFARAVNLGPKDVPGFVAESREPSRSKPHNKAFEDGAQYGRCFRTRKEAKPLMKARSDKFKAGAGLHVEEASSDVEVAPMIAAARRELAEDRRAIQSVAARRCFAHLFDALGARNRAFRVRNGSLRITVGNVHLAPLRLDSVTASTNGGFGFTMRMTVTYTATARGHTFSMPTSLQLDELGFLVGRASVKLGTMAFGASFAPEREAQLFSLLVSRALTASHIYPSITK